MLLLAAVEQLGPLVENQCPVQALGHDIVDLTDVREGFRRFGSRYIRRLFSAAEREFCLHQDDPVPHLAVRFAAKEATIKALGVRDRQPAWVDMEVDFRATGPHMIRLRGLAAAIARQRAFGPFYACLAWDQQVATATVVVAAYEF